MKTLHKTPISLALAASLGMAVSAFDASAVNLATNGIGEVAIAPYYTTRNGWLTLINVTNTRPIPIVVKVRIHEGYNTRDVLDFNVALSANDQWTAVLKEVEETANGTTKLRPALTTDDGSCVIGTAGTETKKLLNGLAFTGVNSDGGKGSSGSADSDDAIDRMKEGYIEFIVMGHADPTTGIGKLIEDSNCTGVRNAFKEANILATARQFGEPINALKFNFRLLNPDKGIEAGGQAVTWANFFNSSSDATVTPDPEGTYTDGSATPATNAQCSIDRGAERRDPAQHSATTPAADWDPTTVATAGGACRNLITAQEDHVFLEPSLNDAFPRVGYIFDEMSSQLWVTNQTVLMNQGLTVLDYDGVQQEARGVDAFSATIQHTGAINEWIFKEPVLGTESSWVVTLPTKSFYVDIKSQKQAGVGSLAADGSTVARRETVYINNATGPYAPFKELFNGLSRSDVTFTVFDREENSPSAIPDPDTIIDSPAPPTPEQPADVLCYEVNVLNFRKNGETKGVFKESELDRTVVDVSRLDQQMGWMELNLAFDAQAQIGLPTALSTNAATTKTLRGLPAIGFMIKNRDLGSPERNYVSTVPHAYKRD